MYLKNQNVEVLRSFVLFDLKVRIFNIDRIYLYLKYNDRSRSCFFYPFIENESSGLSKPHGHHTHLPTFWLIVFIPIARVSIFLPTFYEINIALLLKYFGLNYHPSWVFIVCSRSSNQYSFLPFSSFVFREATQTFISIRKTNRNMAIMKEMAKSSTLHNSWSVQPNDIRCYRAKLAQ